MARLNHQVNQGHPFFHQNNQKGHLWTPSLGTKNPVFRTKNKETNEASEASASASEPSSPGAPGVLLHVQAVLLQRVLHEAPHLSEAEGGGLERSSARKGIRKRTPSKTKTEWENKKPRNRPSRLSKKRRERQKHQKRLQDVPIPPPLPPPAARRPGWPQSGPRPPRSAPARCTRAPTFARRPRRDEAAALKTRTPGRCA